MMIKKIASTKAFKFLVSGGLAFFIDYGIFTICIKIFYLGTGISAVAGMSAGVLTSFSLNKTWTFKSKMSEETHKQLTMYLLLVGFNYFFTVSFLVYLDDFFPVLLLKPISAIMIAVWNFFLCKHIIFKKRG